MTRTIHVDIIITILDIIHRPDFYLKAAMDNVHKEWRLLGCYAVWLLQEPTLRRNYRLLLQGDRNR
jgi:hypothetical protein